MGGLIERITERSKDSKVNSLRHERVVARWIRMTIEAGGPNHEPLLRAAVEHFVLNAKHRNYGWGHFYGEVKAEWPDFPGADQQPLVKWAKDVMPELFG